MIGQLLAHELATTAAPADPLDVVTQQVVAMAAMTEWCVGDLAALLRRVQVLRELS